MRFLLSFKFLSIIFILYIIVGFAQNFFYLDPSSGCFIRIPPSADLNNHKIRQALELLKITSPNDFAMVCGQVTTIDPNISCGQFESGCAQSTPGLISVDTSNHTLAMVAQTIVRVACQSKQADVKIVNDDTTCYQQAYTTLNNLVVY